MSLEAVALNERVNMRAVSFLTVSLKRGGSLFSKQIKIGSSKQSMQR